MVGSGSGLGAFATVGSASGPFAIPVACGGSGAFVLRISVQAGGISLGFKRAIEVSTTSPKDTTMAGATKQIPI